MGNNGAKSDFDSMVQRVTVKGGKLQLTGRYHLPPKRLQDQYVVQDKVLGSGYNGAVRLATSRTDPSFKYAVKSFRLEKMRPEKRAQLESEIEVFLLMDHPHIAQLHDVYESEGMLELVMECMEGGELFDRVMVLKRFSERDCADAVFQMLLALNYIHSHGIVHRDLKLENFLYEKKGGSHLKLIDFGFSKVSDPNVKMRVSCGTLSYVAPEVLDKCYTSQCDMWSLGVIVFVLLSGNMPFSGTDAIQTKNITKGAFKMKPERWNTVSAEAQEFTKSLICVDPTRRLDAEQALAHPFIVNRKRGGRRTHPAEIDTGVVDAFRSYGQSSRFRRCCMEMLAWSLSTEERAQLRQYFIAMDTNQQGTITLSEFRQVLVDKFHIEDTEAREIFEALDANHDEEIHYSNFLAAVMSTRINLHEELLRSAFAKFDTDSSGYITLKNLRQVLGNTYEGEDVADFLKEADLLHDDRISYPEFVAYVKEAPLEGRADLVSKTLDMSIEAHGKSPKHNSVRKKYSANGSSVSRWRLGGECFAAPCSSAKCTVL